MEGLRESAVDKAGESWRRRSVRCQYRTTGVVGLCFIIGVWFVRQSIVLELRERGGSSLLEGDGVNWEVGLFAFKIEIEIEIDV